MSPKKTIGYKNARFESEYFLAKFAAVSRRPSPRVRETLYHGAIQLQLSSRAPNLCELVQLQLKPTRSKPDLSVEFSLLPGVAGSARTYHGMEAAGAQVRHERPGDLPQGRPPQHHRPHPCQRPHGVLVLHTHESVSTEPKPF